MLWVLLGLLSGFFYATADAHAKKIKNCHDNTILWARMCFSIPIGLVAVALFGMPELASDFWQYFILLVVLDMVFSYLYLRAIRLSPLSIVLPLFSLSPLLLLLTSWLILGEFPSQLGLVGVVVIVLGTYILNIDQRKKHPLQPFAALFKEPGARVMLFATLLVSVNANVGKIVIEKSSPTFYFFVESVIISLIFTVLFWKYIQRDRKQISKQFQDMTTMGFSQGLMFLFHSVAIMMTIVPYFVSIKRSSTLFGIMYGKFMFNEKQISQRFLGAAIMIFGGVLIIAGSL